MADIDLYDGGVCVCGEEVSTYVGLSLSSRKSRRRRIVRDPPMHVQDNESWIHVGGSRTLSAAKRAKSTR